MRFWGRGGRGVWVAVLGGVIVGSMGLLVGLRFFWGRWGGEGVRGCGVYVETEVEVEVGVDGLVLC